MCKEGMPIGGRQMLQGNHGAEAIEHVQRKLQERRRGLLGEKRYKKNAVLLPLIKTEQNQLAVVFTKRASTLRRQPGEISFPGGRWEEGDETEWSTALRETSEELRLPANTIQYLGALDVVIMPSQMIVHPFVGFLAKPELIQPNPQEVDEVFSVELDRLLATQPACYEVTIKVQPEANFPFHLIPNGENYAWRTGKIPQLFYEIDGRIIWGLTARILSHFLTIVG
jgi:8-oxo-dGTP pyrophosphatase MutT (NUDIX family)